MSREFEDSKDSNQSDNSQHGQCRREARDIAVLLLIDQTDQLNEVRDNGHDIDDVRTVLDKRELGRGHHEPTDEFEGKPRDTDGFDNEKDPKESCLVARRR